MAARRICVESRHGRSGARLALVVYCALLAVSSPTTAHAQQPVTPNQLSTVVPVLPAAPTPIAIVPLDASSTVTGALEVTSGRAVIAVSGTITSGAKTTEVILPHRGTLWVCASTTVKLATDTSVPAGETPGLMMALDHGALEASFATARNADILLTPDFRILIGAPGAAEVKVRLGQHGDTCIDNPGTNAPYVVVTSVFDGGAYRVQPGQRVMFQHGSLQEVVDQEKEPCGCPPEPRPGSNDFPLAQSAGLAPLAPPAQPAAEAKQPGTGAALNEPLVYQAPAAATDQPAAAAGTAASPSAGSASTPASTAAAQPAAPRKPGFFHRVGSFFRRLFGAE